MPLTKPLLLFAVLSCAGASAQIAVGYQSDSVLLEALEKHFSNKFHGENVCIKRLKNSARVSIIGFRDAEAKCRSNGVFVDSTYFEMKDRTLSKNALAALGWATASRQERGELAKFFVEECLFAFYFGQKQTFATASTDNGGVKIIVSLEYPPGITSRNAPKTFLLDEGGSMLSPNFL